MVFRYPGGKTKLLKKFKQHLNFNGAKSYYEPFVGGGSVLVHVAKSNSGMKLFVNDLDKYVYSFWKLFEIDSDAYFEQLYGLINQIPTVELFKTMRSSAPDNMVELAYYAIFFNRTTFSGIFRSGPIGGYEQKSKWKIACRYNAVSIIKKIKEMRLIFKGRLFVSNQDYKIFLAGVSAGFLYLDPPYFKKGRDLYNHFFSVQDHADLKNILQSLQSWALSYDNCKEIRELYTSNFAKIIEIDCQYSISGQKDSLNYTKEILVVPNANSSD